MRNSGQQRRQFIRSSAFGLIAITAFGSASPQTSYTKNETPGNLFYRYPSMDDTMVSGIVGASHGNFD